MATDEKKKIIRIDFFCLSISPHSDDSPKDLLQLRQCDHEPLKKRRKERNKADFSLPHIILIWAAAVAACFSLRGSKPLFSLGCGVDTQEELIPSVQLSYCCCCCCSRRRVALFPHPDQRRRRRHDSSAAVVYGHSKQSHS